MRTSFNELSLPKYAALTAVAAGAFALSGCGEQPSNDTHHADAYIAEGYINPGSNLRSEPRTENDPNSPPNRCDVTDMSIDVSGSRVYYYNDENDPNGAWYGFPADSLNDPCDDKSGLVWVNEQNVDVDLAEPADVG